jgi:hypothetical protein
MCRGRCCHCWLPFLRLLVLQRHKHSCGPQGHRQLHQVSYLTECLDVAQGGGLTGRCVMMGYRSDVMGWCSMSWHVNLQGGACFRVLVEEQLQVS